MKVWRCRSADVRVWRCRSADVRVWRCRSADVMVWRCRSADVKVWRCRSANVRVWRCRSADVKVWRCRSADVKVWRCRSADVRVWRCITTAAFLRRTLRRRSREKPLIQQNNCSAYSVGSALDWFKEKSTAKTMVFKPNLWVSNAERPFIQSWTSAYMLVRFDLSQT